MPKLNEYLRIKNAAKHLGVWQNTLTNWEVAGKIPVYTKPANNYRLFKLSDLDKLLKQTERLLPNLDEDRDNTSITGPRCPAQIASNQVASSGARRCLNRSKFSLRSRWAIR